MLILCGFLSMKRTIIGTHTHIQPRAQKTIQNTFSTILSPIMSSNAPNLLATLNFLATKPSKPSNHIKIAVKNKAVMYEYGQSVQYKSPATRKTRNILDKVTILAKFFFIYSIFYPLISSSLIMFATFSTQCVFVSSFLVNLQPSMMRSLFLLSSKI